MSGPQRIKQRRHAANSPQACFNCGVTGHFVVACPRPSRESSAGFDPTLSTYLPPQAQQHSQQNYSPYPIQQYAPTNQALVQPIYNGMLPGVLPHTYSSYQPVLATAPEFARTLDYSAPIYAPHNHPYANQSNSLYQQPVSNYSHPNSIKSHQLSPETAYSIPSGQYSIITPNFCNYQLHQNTSFSGPLRVHSTKSNYRFQQSYLSASVSSYGQNNPAIYHNHNQGEKLLSDNVHRDKFGSVKNSHAKKGKLPKPQEISKMATNSSKFSFQNSFGERASVISEICKSKSAGQILDYPNSKSSTKPPGQDTLKDGNSANNESEDEIWDWEYDAIFKGPPSAEIVALAQPLAAGFRSTPVPLVQAWSTSLPSVSRYARKDNEKEFMRSIRCSPQWSYMQEDPAFMEVKLDGPLVPLREVHNWLAARYGAEMCPSLIDEQKLANGCCKRERPRRPEYQSKKIVAHKKIGLEFEGETGWPASKKIKITEFGDND